MSREDLLARLPAEVATPLREVLARHPGIAPAPMFAEDAYRGLGVTSTATVPTGLDPLLVSAFEAASWPSHRDPVPLPEELTPTQRALAELVASLVELPLHRFAIPQTAWARRRWLGLDPAGPCERLVTFRVGGSSHTAPLYRALRALRDAKDASAPAALFDTLALGDRVIALTELSLRAYRVDPPSLRDFDAIDQDDGAWAPALADRVAAWFAPGAPLGERAGLSAPPWEAAWWIFLGLARAHETLGLELSPRWDPLLPAGWASMGARCRRCLDALPPERRGPALASALSRSFPHDVLRCALEHLPLLPSIELLDRAIEATDDGVGDLGVLPRRVALARLREAVAAHPALVRHLDDHLAALPTVETLRVRATRAPSDLRELTALQRAQLVATRGIGNAGLEPDAPAEGPLAYVSFDELEDEHGTLVYETARFMEEDGAVLRAGTTEIVAYLCQFQLDAEPALAESLHLALHRGLNAAGRRSAE